MKKVIIGLTFGLGLAACSGEAPFGGDVTETDGSGGAGAIPEVLAADLNSFSYDPNNQTLTISGITLEDGPFEETYRRRPNLDRGDYEAYTAQDGSLDRHSTAYVRDIRGTRAAIAVTGGQFSYYFAGGAYDNGGDFSAPVTSESDQDGGLVSYAGTYVGLLNVSGSGEDLIPVTPGTPGSFVPGQAAEVTGQILINASFSDGTVNGTITNRVVQDFNGTDGNPLQVEDLALAPAPIADDGTFFGDTSVETQVRGEYGGIFGGTNATEVAGVVRAENHMADFNEEEEYGLFVLAQCGTAQADPVCDQPVE